MGRKKVENTPDKDYSNITIDDDFFKDLSKGTDFVMADEGSLMSARMKVPTPLLVINCIWGGGIPLGIMGEVSGPPASGKSTFAYQCMGNYQKYISDGVSVIYDQESSMDRDRLHSLGVDVGKVLRLPSTSMESSFENMFKMLNKLKEIHKTKDTISSFQIYDTLAAGGTNKQHESINQGGGAFNAGSMMESPRIIKQNLLNVFQYIEEFPVMILFLNQVFTQGVGTYAPSVKSGGGYGLSHNIHIHIVFGNNKDVFEDGFLIGTESMVKLEKSKLSPKLTEIPCYIDATQGGKIDEVESFFRYCTNKANIIKTGSWYSIADTIDYLTNRYYMDESVEGLKNNIRKDDLRNRMKEEPDLLDLMQIRLIDFINDIYPLQKDINKEYKQTIIERCKYFKSADPKEPSLEESSNDIESNEENSDELLEDDENYTEEE